MSRSREAVEPAKPKPVIPPESPLVPNRAIQRLYAGMVESSLLEAHVRKRDRKSQRPRVQGQEAARAAALLDLTPEDFTSDLYGSVTTAYLRGEPLPVLMKHRPGTAATLPGLLPELSDSRERLQQAMGVAIVLKRLHLKGVVVFFAEQDEIKPIVWLPSLHRAAEGELPMLFVVLPPDRKEIKLKVFGLGARATAAGVPGIPVDASDAIALYRVMQESLGRARAGGGPALMECVPFIPLDEKGKQKKAPLPDPIDALAETLLRRGICDPDWLQAVTPAFRARLKAL